MEIRWSASANDERRTALRADIIAVKPVGRARRLSHDAARAAFERRGERILATPDAEVRRRPWVARVYYVSIGGELLCFEAEMSEQAATALSSECRRIRNPDAWTGGTVGSPRSDSYDAEAFPATPRERKLHPIRHEARLVVLPSQRVEPVQVDEVDEDPENATLAA
jgi:hypothetical protein